MKTPTLYTWYSYLGIQIDAHVISSEMISKQRDLGRGAPVPVDWIPVGLGTQS